MSILSKRLIFTVVLELISLPLWTWLAKVMVVPKDYVPEGEKGTEMVSGLGEIFIMTLLVTLSLLLFYILASKIFKAK